MTSSSFPDVNVWLALGSDEHVHHRAALDWWDSQNHPILFCRVTQMGFLRLLTTSAAMNGKPVQMQKAWDIYDGFLRDARVDFAPEPARMEQRFRMHSSGKIASPKLWTDAYLAAFASEVDSAIVTFDAALARLAGVSPLA